jgi:hypothetical protein
MRLPWEKKDNREQCQGAAQASSAWRKTIAESAAATGKD